MDRVVDDARGGPTQPGRGVEDDPLQEVGEDAIGERLDPTLPGAESAATVLERLANLIRGVMTPQPREPVTSTDEFDRTTAMQAEVSAKILGGIIEEFISKMPTQVVARGADAMTAVRHSVSDAASRAVGKNAQRLRVTLVNRDAANDVFISSNMLDSSSGFQLSAGETITIETRDEIWAICASGNTATLHVLQEFVY